MRRKIVILASWYPSADAPVNGVFIQDQARLLAERYEVIVLVPQTIGIGAFLSGHRLSEIEQDGALRVYREYIPVPPYVFTFNLLGRWVAARRGIQRIIREYGIPDLIHAHVVLPGGWIALQLSRKLAVPVALTEHSGPFSAHLDAWFKRRFVRHALNGTHVLAVSPALKQHILSFLPDIRVDVLPNVISTRFFTPGESDVPVAKDRKKRILVVALLTAVKGIPYLLDALALLRARGDQSFELVIGGDGPDRVKLEQLALDRGLGESCRFVGLLNKEQVRDWMRWCDVLVLPSLHETFGIVVGEAMACGKPVIATRCGGPEYVVDDSSGILAPPADAPALANALEQFCSGRVTFDAEAIRRRVVERFGEEAFLRQIAVIYDELWTQPR